MRITETVKIQEEKMAEATPRSFWPKFECGNACSEAGIPKSAQHAISAMPDGEM